MPKQLHYRMIKNITKEYPNKIKVIKYHTPYPVQINKEGVATTKIHVNLKDRIRIAAKMAKRDLEDNRAERRAKSQIRDIIQCNRWEMWCTFTFNNRVVDRYDPVACKQALQRWISRIRRKYGKFQYLIVPEFHKDQQALHFHALFNAYNGKLSDSGKKRNGKTIWRIDDYSLGFADCVVISPTPQDIERVGNYMTKYITKDMPHFEHKKRFWVSRNLLRPLRTINDFRFEHLEKVTDFATLKSGTRYIVRR